MPGKERIFSRRSLRSKTRLISSNMTAAGTEPDENAFTSEGVFAATVQENRAPSVQLLSEAPPPAYTPPPAYNSLGLYSGKNNDRPICRDNARGICRFGSERKFSHPENIGHLHPPFPSSFSKKPIADQLKDCTDNEIPEFLRNQLSQVNSIRRFIPESAPETQHLYAIVASTEMSPECRVGKSVYREADVKIGGLNLDFGPAIIVNLFQIVTGLKVVRIAPQKTIAALWVAVPNASSPAERETALQEAYSKFETNMVWMMPFSAAPVVALLATGESAFSFILSQMKRSSRVISNMHFPRHAMTAAGWIPNALQQPQRAFTMFSACAVATPVNDSSDQKSDSNPSPEQQTDIRSASKKYTHKPYTWN